MVGAGDGVKWTRIHFLNLSMQEIKGKIFTQQYKFSNKNQLASNRGILKNKLTTFLHHFLAKMVISGTDSILSRQLAVK